MGNVSMYQERPVPQLHVKYQNKFAMMWTVKFAFQFQRRTVSQYNVHPVSPLTSKYANQSQNKSANKYLVKYARMSQKKNVNPSKRKSVLLSQKLAASLSHVKSVFLFQTKLARPYQSRSALNLLPRNVAMSQERS